MIQKVEPEKKTTYKLIVKSSILHDVNVCDFLIFCMSIVHAHYTQPTKQNIKHQSTTTTHYGPFRFRTKTFCVQIEKP